VAEGTTASALEAALEDRLIRYVVIDTQSDESERTSPSTAKQYDLLRLLADELRSLGAEDVTLTDYGAVLATIPATGSAATEMPTVGFLAHVDTAPAFSGTNVAPIIHRHYVGDDITLPRGSHAVLSPGEYPYLAQKVGETIITGSGDTLLGADDKAGVAIVMTLAEYLLQHPQLVHGPIRVAFTPDEEVGRGVHPNLPGDLRVDFAYTLDGGELGEIVFETFSGDHALVRIEGVSTHPGQAKGSMVNALTLAARIITALPQTSLTPETTGGREGFIHLTHMSGTAAAAELHFILRDFELEGLRAHGELLKQVCGTMHVAEPRAQITCDISSSYRNMRYWLEKDMRLVELAQEACRRVGIEPFSIPIRGGTDGSRLTELGVPTPNIFTGMQNIHGPLEWISVADMARATDVCITLAQLWTQNAEPSGAPVESAKVARADSHD
jgi:tripeptide aminopeptidase